MIFSQCNSNCHFTGSDHPEKDQRARKIISQFSEKQVCTRLATAEELGLVHTKEYVDLVVAECAELAFLETNELSTGDVVISSQSHIAAINAVGTVLDAVDAIFNSTTQRAFCPVRPPGHHASAENGSGFCLFNNAVIAARYAQKFFSITKVAILDWDVHHGNGTQDLVTNDPRILYFSTHQSDHYPNTGLATDKGCGNVHNFPIEKGENSRVEVLSAFTDKLPQILERFQPELIIISCGLDSRELDPLGDFNLTDKDFSELTKIVVDEAVKHCQGRVLSVLEGGYSLRGLPKAAKAHVEALKT